MKKLFTLLLASGSFLSVLAQDTTRLSLLFLGDIMQHDSQIADAYNPVLKRYDYTSCFQFVKPYTQAADLAIGNLEVTLAGPPHKGYPQFSAPDELLTALKEMGMDVLVTANNHCVDRGRKGLERTLQMLDSFDIQHTGTFADEVARLNEYPLLITKNGFRLALLNYTYGTNGLPVTHPNIVNMIDTAAMKIDFRKARAMRPDIIIVLPHWGNEYQSLPSKWQQEVAAFCFKQGASLVIGAHPHVLQPIRWNKNKNQLIAYSLGNFVSGQRKRYTDGGAMVAVGLQKVTFKADSAVTVIDSAGYILEWVYRTNDAEKNYYVLPVPVFENDSTLFIKDAASREAFQLFVNDSRALFKKHNLNVRESAVAVKDPITRYKVLVMDADPKQQATVKIQQLPYGLESETDERGDVLFYSGNFSYKHIAEKYRATLMNKYGYKGAVVAEFVNGHRIK